MWLPAQQEQHIVGRFGPERILDIALLWPVGLSFTLIAALLVGFSSVYLVLSALFGLLVGHGFISPNAAALGLSKHGEQAGTASAVMGVIQFGLGIVTIFMTSLFKATSALPLALVIGACSCLARLSPFRGMPGAEAVLKRHKVLAAGTGQLFEVR